MTDHKMFAAGEMKLDDAGTIELAFAQLGVVDHDGDLTLPGAFPTKSVPMSAYGHTSWDGALPVGRGSISEQGDWAVFNGKFFLSTTHGRDAYETVKGLGELAEFSYGYNIIEGGPGTFEGKAVRELRSLDVFEVSPVLKGAGVGTHVRSIKGGSLGTDLPMTEYLSWVRDVVTAARDRSADRIAGRIKEGRTLSTANRASLEAIRDRLRELGASADELDALLEAAAPKDDAPKADRAVTIAVAEWLARNPLVLP